MSQQFNQSVSIPCNKCKLEFPTTICTNISSSRDADQISTILDGTFFIRKCPKCNTDNVLNFPVGYTNETQNRTIMFLPISKEMSSTLNIPDDAHVTHDMLTFIEKVRIIEMGMDDKIVELVKIIAYNQVAQLGQVPNDGLESIDCWIKDNRAIDLDLRCSGRHFLLEVPYKMYKDIKNQFGLKLKSYDEPNVVDINWALMFLNSIAIEEASNQNVNDDDWDEIVFE